MATNTNAKVAVNHLKPEHLEAFDQTFRRILSTDLTGYTLAQIVDGLPTRDVYYNYANYHAEIDNHVEPKPESVEMVKTLQENFRPDALHVDSEIAQAYQNTSIGSRAFKLRLFEMVATAFHDTAALLFDKTNDRPYRSPGSSRPPGPISVPDHLKPRPIPTFFYHMDYLDHDQYPLGIADVVGYWAEYQVFGGVVLFDRGEGERDCRDVFIHPTAGYRIFKLSEAQLEQFIDFALNNRAQPSNDAPCPLPFRAEKYAQRIEQTESMGLHIFRNKYERRPRRFTSDGIRTNYRSMRRLDDFPELVDFLEKRNRTGSGSGQGQD